MAGEIRYLLKFAALIVFVVAVVLGAGFVVHRWHLGVIFATAMTVGLLGAFVVACWLWQYRQAIRNSSNLSKASGTPVFAPLVAEALILLTILADVGFQSIESLRTHRVSDSLGLAVFGTFAFGLDTFRRIRKRRVAPGVAVASAERLDRTFAFHRSPDSPQKRSHFRRMYVVAVTRVVLLVACVPMMLILHRHLGITVSAVITFAIVGGIGAAIPRLAGYDASAVPDVVAETG